MALGWLAGDAGDEVEVLVQVQDGEPPELSSGGNQQVGNRRRAVLALACQCQLDLNCSVLNRGCHVLHWHCRDRWGREHRTGVCLATSGVPISSLVTDVT